MNMIVVNHLGMCENILGIFQLTDKETIRCGCSFKIEKKIETIQILSSKFRIKLASKVVKKREVVTCNDDVNYIEKQINNFRLPMKDKEGQICTTERKPKGDDKRAKSLKPGTRHLFGVIKSFFN